MHEKRNINKVLNDFFFLVCVGTSSLVGGPAMFLTPPLSALAAPLSILSFFFFIFPTALTWNQRRHTLVSAEGRRPAQQTHV